MLTETGFTIESSRTTPEQLAKLLAAFPDESSVWREIHQNNRDSQDANTQLSPTDYERLVWGAFDSQLAFAIWYHILPNWENGIDLPESLYVPLLASKIRRYLKQGFIRVGKKGTRKVTKPLHNEAKDRLDLVQEILLDRLGGNSEGVRYLSKDTLYFRLPSRVITADRKHFNKGTPYWTTKHYTKGKDGIGWVEITKEQYQDAQTESENHPNLLQSKIIVRHLQDTVDERHPNFSPEEYQTLLARITTPHYRTIFELLARGFGHRQIQAAAGCSPNTIQTVVAFVKEHARDLLSESSPVPYAAIGCKEVGEAHKYNPYRIPTQTEFAVAVRQPEQKQTKTLVESFDVPTLRVWQQTTLKGKKAEQLT